MINQETICAVSTAPGAGGVAVIRVSGTEAITICDTIFTPKIEGKNLQNQKAYTLRYGSIRRGGRVDRRCTYRPFPRPSFIYRRRHCRDHLSRFGLYPATDPSATD